MRVLFVVPYLPSAIRSRALGFIRALSELGHTVHVVALRPPEDAWAPIDAVARHCAALEIFPLSRSRTLLSAAGALPGGLPLQAAYGRHAAARRRIRALASDGGFDVLHVEHLRGVELAGAPAPLPTLFDAVDSISLLFGETQRQAPGWRQRMMARLELGRTRRFEARAPWMFDRLIVTSSRDRDAFLALAGTGAAARIGVVSNGVTVEETVRPVPHGPPTVVFSGKMSFHANDAAARLLVTEIMPRVWQTHPGTRLVLAGKGPSPSLLRVATDERIEITGYVDDLASIVRRATLAVAPLPYGVGVQNKVLEAMACGVPVVASPVTAFGVDALPGRDWLLGGTSEELAAAVVRLIDNPALRERLATAGRLFVRERHRWSLSAERLIAQYEKARAASQSRRAATISR